MTGLTKSPHHSLHGQLTNEVQNGVTIARTYDTLNRPTGYILMQNGGASPPGEPFAVSYAYAPSAASAGVVSTQSRRVDFAYSYLPGTNLVSGKTATLGNHSPFSILHSQFAYEPHRDLVASVANTATNPSTLQPFYGGDDADNSALPVFKEVAIEALRPAPTLDDYDEIAAVTGRVFVAQSPETFEYDADETQWPGTRGV